jgi:hypothetical protein
MVNVIAGGLALGGDTLRERRSYVKSTNNHIVLEVKKKRPRPDEEITFFEKDGARIAQPHDDALVLSLKINTHRVRRVLIDTEFCECYVFGSLCQNGIYPTSLSKSEYSIGRVHMCGNGPRGAHEHESRIQNPAMCYFPHGRLFDSECLFCLQRYIRLKNFV